MKPHPHHLHRIKLDVQTDKRTRLNLSLLEEEEVHKANQNFVNDKPGTKFLART